MCVFTVIPLFRPIRALSGTALVYCKLQYTRPRLMKKCSFGWFSTHSAPEPKLSRFWGSSWVPSGRIFGHHSISHVCFRTPCGCPRAPQERPGVPRELQRRGSGEANWTPRRYQMPQKSNFPKVLRDTHLPMRSSSNRRRRRRSSSSSCWSLASSSSSRSSHHTAGRRTESTTDF